MHYPEFPSKTPFKHTIEIASFSLPLQVSTRYFGLGINLGQAMKFKMELHLWLLAEAHQATS